MKITNSLCIEIVLVLMTVTFVEHTMREAKELEKYYSGWHTYKPNAIQKIRVTLGLFLHLL